MSEQAIAQKTQLVDQVADRFSQAASSIVVDLRGLTVEENTQLRNALREENIELEVIKNNILKRAADKANFSELTETFSGPSAIAFSKEDAVAPTRILKKFSDDIEALEVKGGVVDGKVSTLDEINRFATLPSREGLLGQLMGGFQFPIRSFLYAVNAIIEQSGEEVPAAKEATDDTDVKTDDAPVTEAEEATTAVEETESASAETETKEEASDASSSEE